MSDKRYFVHTKETCSRCEGDAVIRNPEWEPVDEYVSTLEIAGWRMQAAVDLFIAQHFGTDNGSEWPAEDINCPECDGSGAFYNDEDITDVVNYARKMLSAGELRL